MSKVKTLVGAIAILGLLAVGLPAFAEDDPAAAPERGANPRDAYDEDGDGKLTGSELDDFRDAMQKQRGPQGAQGPRDGSGRMRLDTDGDGVVSDEERKAGRKARQLSRWDADGDGKLSDDERAAAHEQRRKNHKANLEKYDADGDGKLSQAERETARADGAVLGPRGGKKGGKKGAGRGGAGNGQGPPDDPS